MKKLAILSILVAAIIAAVLYLNFSGVSEQDGDAYGTVGAAEGAESEGEVLEPDFPPRESSGARNLQLSVELTSENLPSGLPALPEVNAPLDAQLPDLLQRAEAGDPVATCRVATAFNHCAEQARNKAFTSQMRRSLEKGEGPWDNLLIETISRFEEPIDGLSSFCDGLDFRDSPDIGRLVRRNYQALSPRQKTLMVMTRPDGSLRRVHSRGANLTSALYVIPEYLAEHSVSMLREAYAEGDPLALEGLVLLYAPGQALAPETVAVWQPNPRLFLKYSWIMRDLFGLESLGLEAAHLMRAAAASVSRETFESIRNEVQAEVERWRSLEVVDPQLLTGHREMPDRFRPFECEGR